MIREPGKHACRRHSGSHCIDTDPLIGDFLRNTPHRCVHGRFRSAVTEMRLIPLQRSNGRDSNDSHPRMIPAFLCCLAYTFYKSKKVHIEKGLQLLGLKHLQRHTHGNPRCIYHAIQTAVFLNGLFDHFLDSGQLTDIRNIVSVPFPLQFLQSCFQLVFRSGNQSQLSAYTAERNGSLPANAG